MNESEKIYVPTQGTARLAFEEQEGKSKQISALS